MDFAQYHALPALQKLAMMGQPQQPSPYDNLTFYPSSEAPTGYAEMFQGPIGQQPRAGNPSMMDLLMNGTDIPNGIPPQAPQNLFDMLKARPEMVGNNGPDRFAGEAPTPMPRPVKPDSVKIRKGENLTVIAKRYGVTVEYLAKKNGIKNANKIKAGATLKL